MPWAQQSFFFILVSKRHCPLGKRKSEGPVTLASKKIALLFLNITKCIADTPEFSLMTSQEPPFSTAASAALLPTFITCCSVVGVGGCNNGRARGALKKGGRKLKMKGSTEVVTRRKDRRKMVCLMNKVFMIMKNNINTIKEWVYVLLLILGYVLSICMHACMHACLVLSEFGLQPLVVLMNSYFLFFRLRGSVCFCFLWMRTWSLEPITAWRKGWIKEIIGWHWIEGLFL